MCKLVASDTCGTGECYHPNLQFCVTIAGDLSGSAGGVCGCTTPENCIDKDTNSSTFDCLDLSAVTNTGKFKESGETLCKAACNSGSCYHSENHICRAVIPGILQSATNPGECQCVTQHHCYKNEYVFTFTCDSAVNQNGISNNDSGICVTGDCTDNTNDCYHPDSKVCKDVSGVAAISRGTGGECVCADTIHCISNEDDATFTCADAVSPKWSPNDGKACLSACPSGECGHPTYRNCVTATADMVRHTDTVCKCNDETECIESPRAASFACETLSNGSSGKVAPGDGSACIASDDCGTGKCWHYDTRVCISDTGFSKHANNHCFCASDFECIDPTRSTSFSCLTLSSSSAPLVLMVDADGSNGSICKQTTCNSDATYCFNPSTRICTTMTGKGLTATGGQICTCTDTLDCIDSSISDDTFKCITLDTDYVGMDPSATAMANEFKDTNETMCQAECPSGTCFHKKHRICRTITGTEMVGTTDKAQCTCVADTLKCIDLTERNITFTCLLLSTSGSSPNDTLVKDPGDSFCLTACPAGECYHPSHRICLPVTGTNLDNTNTTDTGVCGCKQIRCIDPGDRSITFDCLAPTSPSTLLVDEGTTLCNTSQSCSTTFCHLPETRRCVDAGSSPVSKAGDGTCECTNHYECIKDDISDENSPSQQCLSINVETSTNATYLALGDKKMCKLVASDTCGTGECYHPNLQFCVTIAGDLSGSAGGVCGCTTPENCIDKDTNSSTFDCLDLSAVTNTGKFKESGETLCKAACNSGSCYHSENHICRAVIPGILQSATNPGECQCVTQHHCYKNEYVFTFTCDSAVNQNGISNNDSGICVTGDCTDNTNDCYHPDSKVCKDVSGVAAISRGTGGECVCADTIHCISNEDDATFTCADAVSPKWSPNDGKACLSACPSGECGHPTYRNCVTATADMVRHTDTVCKCNDETECIESPRAASFACETLSNGSSGKVAPGDGSACIASDDCGTGKCWHYDTRVCISDTGFSKHANNHCFCASDFECIDPTRSTSFSCLTLSSSSAPLVLMVDADGSNGSICKQTTCNSDATYCFNPSTRICTTMTGKGLTATGGQICTCTDTLDCIDSSISDDTFKCITLDTDYVGMDPSATAMANEFKDTNETMCQAECPSGTCFHKKHRICRTITGTEMVGTTDKAQCTCVADTLKCIDLTERNITFTCLLLSTSGSSPNDTLVKDPGDSFCLTACPAGECYHPSHRICLPVTGTNLDNTNTTDTGVCGCTTITCINPNDRSISFDCLELDSDSSDSIINSFLVDQSVPECITNSVCPSSQCYHPRFRVCRAADTGNLAGPTDVCTCTDSLRCIDVRDVARSGSDTFDCLSLLTDSSGNAIDVLLKDQSKTNCVNNCPSGQCFHPLYRICKSTTSDMIRNPGGGEDCWCDNKDKCIPKVRNGTFVCETPDLTEFKEVRKRTEAVCTTDCDANDCWLKNEFICRDITTGASKGDTGTTTEDITGSSGTVTVSGKCSCNNFRHCIYEEADFQMHCKYPNFIDDDTYDISNGTKIDLCISNKTCLTPDRCWHPYYRVCQPDSPTLLAGGKCERFHYQAFLKKTHLDENVHQLYNYYVVGFSFHKLDDSDYPLVNSYFIKSQYTNNLRVKDTYFYDESADRDYYRKQQLKNRILIGMDLQPPYLRTEVVFWDAEMNSSNDTCVALNDASGFRRVVLMKVQYFEIPGNALKFYNQISGGANNALFLAKDGTITTTGGTFTATNSEDYTLEEVLRGFLVESCTDV